MASPQQQGVREPSKSPGLDSGPSRPAIPQNTEHSTKAGSLMVDLTRKSPSVEVVPHSQRDIPQTSARAVLQALAMGHTEEETEKKGEARKTEETSLPPPPKQPDPKLNSHEQKEAVRKYKTLTTGIAATKEFSPGAEYAPFPYVMHSMHMHQAQANALSQSHAGHPHVHPHAIGMNARGFPMYMSPRIPYHRPEYSVLPPLGFQSMVEMPPRSMNGRESPGHLPINLAGYGHLHPVHAAYYHGMPTGPNLPNYRALEAHHQRQQHAAEEKLPSRQDISEHELSNPFISRLSPNQRPGHPIITETRVRSSSPVDPSKPPTSMTSSDPSKGYPPSYSPSERPKSHSPAMTYLQVSRQSSKPTSISEMQSRAAVIPDLLQDARHVFPDPHRLERKDDKPMKPRTPEPRTEMRGDSRTYPDARRDKRHDERPPYPQDLGRPKPTSDVRFSDIYTRQTIPDARDGNIRHKEHKPDSNRLVLTSDIRRSHDIRMDTRSEVKHDIRGSSYSDSNIVEHKPERDVRNYIPREMNLEIRPSNVVHHHAARVDPRSDKRMDSVKGDLQGPHQRVDNMQRREGRPIVDAAPHGQYGHDGHDGRYYAIPGQHTRVLHRPDNTGSLLQPQQRPEMVRTAYDPRHDIQHEIIQYPVLDSRDRKDDSRAKPPDAFPERRKEEKGHDRILSTPVQVIQSHSNQDKQPAKPVDVILIPDSEKGKLNTESQPPSSSTSKPKKKGSQEDLMSNLATLVDVAALARPVELPLHERIERERLRMAAQAAQATRSSPEIIEQESEEKTKAISQESSPDLSFTGQSLKYGISIGRVSKPPPLMPITGAKPSHENASSKPPNTSSDTKSPPRLISPHSVSQTIVSTERPVGSRPSNSPVTTSSRQTPNPSGPPPLISRVSSSPVLHSVPPPSLVDSGQAKPVSPVKVLLDRPSDANRHDDKPIPQYSQPSVVRNIFETVTYLPQGASGIIPPSALLQRHPVIPLPHQGSHSTMTRPPPPTTTGRDWPQGRSSPGVNAAYAEYLLGTQKREQESSSRYPAQTPRSSTVTSQSREQHPREDQYHSRLQTTRSPSKSPPQRPPGNNETRMAFPRITVDTFRDSFSPHDSRVSVIRESGVTDRENISVVSGSSSGIEERKTFDQIPESVTRHRTFDQEPKEYSLKRTIDQIPPGNARRKHLDEETEEKKRDRTHGPQHTGNRTFDQKPEGQKHSRTHDQEPEEHIHHRIIYPLTGQSASRTLDHERSPHSNIRERQQLSNLQQCHDDFRRFSHDPRTDHEVSDSDTLSAEEPDYVPESGDEISASSSADKAYLPHEDESLTVRDESNDSVSRSYYNTKQKPTATTTTEVGDTPSIVSMPSEGVSSSSVLSPSSIVVTSPSSTDVNTVVEVPSWTGMDETKEAEPKHTETAQADASLLNDQPRDSEATAEATALNDSNDESVQSLNSSQENVCTISKTTADSSENQGHEQQPAIESHVEPPNAVVGSSNADEVLVPSSSSGIEVEPRPSSEPSENQAVVSQSSDAPSTVATTTMSPQPSDSASNATTNSTLIGSSGIHVTSPLPSGDDVIEPVSSDSRDLPQSSTSIISSEEVIAVDIPTQSTSVEVPESTSVVQSFGEETVARGEATQARVDSSNWRQDGNVSGSSSELTSEHRTDLATNQPDSQYIDDEMECTADSSVNSASHDQPDSHTDFEISTGLPCVDSSDSHINVPYSEDNASHNDNVRLEDQTRSENEDEDDIVISSTMSQSVGSPHDSTFAISTTRHSSLDDEERPCPEIYLPDQDEESSIPEPDMLMNLSDSNSGVHDDSLDDLSDFDETEHSAIPTFVGEFIPSSGDGPDSSSCVRTQTPDLEGSRSNEAEPVYHLSQSETYIEHTSTTSDEVQSSVPLLSTVIHDADRPPDEGSPEAPVEDIHDSEIRPSEDNADSSVPDTKFIESNLDQQCVIESSSNKDQNNDKNQSGIADTTCIGADVNTTLSDRSTASSPAVVPSDVTSESMEAEHTAEPDQTDILSRDQFLIDEPVEEFSTSISNTYLPETTPVSPASPESTDQQSELDNISPAPVWPSYSQTSTFPGTATQHYSPYSLLSTQRSNAFPFSTLNVASNSTRSSPVSLLNIGRSQSPCPAVLPREQEPIPILSDNYEPLSDDDDNDDLLLDQTF